VKVALVVGGGVPNPTAGGATLTTWTIVGYLLDQRHDVVIFPLVGSDYIDPTGATFEGRVERLEELGATVTPLKSKAGSERDGLSTSLRARLGRWVDPPERLLYPTLADRETVREALEQAAPDAVLGYHWDALAALDGVHVAPKLGVAVDLSHLPHLYRWRAGLLKHPMRSARTFVHLQALLRKQPALMVRFLDDCEAAGDFAAHHAEWLRDHGVARCEYLRTPVPDPLGAAWRVERDRLRPERPRILLMGHLKGVATLEGLDLFAEDVLPRLEQRLGTDGFEVRLVGGYEPPQQLRRALDRPSVTFCGHSDDPGDEFLSADALVVPTPIKLGTRVRILTAFSYGCPVVAHEANALGIPELAHGENVLLGRNADDLADAIVRVTGDSVLRRRLEDSGRATFERWFAPGVAAERLVELLGSIAAGRVHARAAPV
jgi:glycosyltransferase involved in cell wall biosynthesis